MLALDAKNSALAREQEHFHTAQKDRTQVPCRMRRGGGGQPCSPPGFALGRDRKPTDPQPGNVPFCGPSLVEAKSRYGRFLLGQRAGGPRREMLDGCAAFSSPSKITAGGANR